MQKKTQVAIILESSAIEFLRDKVIVKICMRPERFGSWPKSLAKVNLLNVIASMRTIWKKVRVKADMLGSASFSISLFDYFRLMRDEKG